MLSNASSISIDDEPYLWNDILEAFDNIQYTKLYGDKVAHHIIKETSLWLRVIEKGESNTSFRFVCASSVIAYSCSQVLNDIEVSICIKAPVDHFQPNSGPELLKKGKLYINAAKTDW